MKSEFWKSEAIYKLMNYAVNKAALKNLSDEIRKLESEACSIKSATTDGTPVRGGGSGREERLLSNIVRREELKAMLKRAALEVRMVDRGLSVLTPEERHILDVMYVIREKGYIDRLMEEYDLADERSVYKKAYKPLLRFTKAMYGVDKK